MRCPRARGGYGSRSLNIERQQLRNPELAKQGERFRGSFPQPYQPSPRTLRRSVAQGGPAESCLFVSWGGFKPNVQQELARGFFVSGWWPSRMNAA